MTIEFKINAIERVNDTEIRVIGNITNGTFNQEARIQITDDGVESLGSLQGKLVTKIKTYAKKVSDNNDRIIAIRAAGVGLVITV